MAKVTAYLDPIGNTLNLWWGDKTTAHESVEVENPHRDDVIILDKNKRPIGLEVIGFFPEELDVVKRLSIKKIFRLISSKNMISNLLPDRLTK